MHHHVRRWIVIAPSGRDEHVQRALVEATEAEHRQGGGAGEVATTGEDGDPPPLAFGDRPTVVDEDADVRRLPPSRLHEVPKPIETQVPQNLPTRDNPLLVGKQ
ncbi:hypothetical protein Vau01_033340 [Virgisporangium aurantiacum]|uniref:Uncharacterized protein n=1 Tax=Virgisporangium aurantiacum TaxID=175570 RepID=A0A8J3Z3V1_9ACTN|nr:hypothetical protein Vau01_033340 [Virgisporangium aurantiacum]